MYAIRSACLLFSLKDEVGKMRRMRGKDQLMDGWLSRNLLPVHNTPEGGVRDINDQLYATFKTAIYMNIIFVINYLPDVSLKQLAHGSATKRV